MRWIDRGPEPAGVAGYAERFTPGWVDYFQNGVGERPEDFRWGEFRPVLEGRTNNVCWYCERECDTGADPGWPLAPTVDHFRPLSRFPQLAYEWSNWIFSCRRCNSEKQNKWPETGYVDPCTADVTERPEQYFGYDAATGDIVPRNGLSETAQRRAENTIEDLGLNEKTLSWLRFRWVRGFIAEVLELPAAERQAVAAAYVEQSREYAGIAVMLMEQLRRNGRI